MCHQRRSVIRLFLVAWALRVVAVLAVQYYLQQMVVPARQFVIEGDAEGYWHLAHCLNEGQPYQIYTPPRMVLRMPGFPLLLAASIRLFGDSLLAARLVLATIGALGCVGVYQLGHRLFSHRTGMIAGGLAALSPIFVGFSAIELTETVFAVSLVFGLVPLARGSRECESRFAKSPDSPNPVDPRPHPERPQESDLPSQGVAVLFGSVNRAASRLTGLGESGDNHNLRLALWSRSGTEGAEPRIDLPLDNSATLTASTAMRAGAIAGLWAGVGCYLRPSWLLFPVCLALWLWGLKPTRNRLWLGVWTVGCMLATLLPWGLRNQLVTGHFTLTTLWMGPSLYDGWNPENTTGDSDMAFFDQENLMSRMSEYDMDREYRQRAWQFAFQNPGRVAALAWKKSLRYWNPLPNADQFKSRRSLRLISLGWYVVVFLPALWGAWTQRRALGVLAITAGPILYFAALHLVFVSSVRYRLPGEYPLLVLSAIGWESLARRLRMGGSSEPGQAPLSTPSQTS